MKANRKFLNGDDEAVSPVIAVILMVAITVVLAATVYVWVSGFSGSGAASASMSVSQVASLSSATPEASTENMTSGLRFTITSVSSGFAAGNLKVINPDTGYSWSLNTNGTLFANEFSVDNDGGAALSATTDILGAGDVVDLYYETGKIVVGNKIQFIDTNSNNVIATAIVR